MRLVIFGLSLTSSWGNGHATTYRALLRALHQRGHDITFFEKDVEWYASNRDLPEPDFCKVLLYDDWKSVLSRVRAELREADAAMVGSYFPDGIAAIDEMLDASPRVKCFYDIDTPITIAALREQGRADYLESRQIPGLDIYFSFTGGPMLGEIEQRFGASRASALYCSFDPEQYRPYPVNPDFACDLSYMGTYSPDRQPKLEDLLCGPARQFPAGRFVVAGPQYPAAIEWPDNVRRIAHLSPRWHAQFYSSSRFTLNVTRRDMVLAGYSPSVRLFEAAACGTAIISDNWPGLDSFFIPGEEILLPACGSDVVRYLAELTKAETRRVGQAARRRVLQQHTSSHRALEFEREVQSASSFRQPATLNA